MVQELESRSMLQNQAEIIGVLLDREGPNFVFDGGRYSNVLRKMDRERERKREIKGIWERDGKTSQVRVEETDVLVCCS